MLLQEGDDCVIALLDDGFDLIPVGAGVAAHIIQHLMPAITHALTRGVGRLLIFLMVLDQPGHDLLVRAVEQFLHFLNELPGIREHLFIVALDVLDIIVDAFDL